MNFGRPEKTRQTVIKAPKDAFFVNPEIKQHFPTKFELPFLEQIKISSSRKKSLSGIRVVTSIVPGKKSLPPWMLLDRKIVVPFWGTMSTGLYVSPMKQSAISDKVFSGQSLDKFL
jgi:hypothetical protein